MRLDHHVHYSDQFQNRLLEVLQQLRTEIMGVSIKLQSLLDATAASSAAEISELGSISQALVTALQGQAAITAQAVADALRNQGIAEDAAADEISAAQTNVQNHINAIFATLPTGSVTQPAGSGSDTVAGSGAGTDATSGAAGDDSTAATGGSDTISGAQGSDSTGATDTEASIGSSDSISGGNGDDSLNTGAETTAGA